MFGKLIVAFLLLGGTAMGQFTDHPRFAHIDTLVKAFVQSVSDKQAEYYALNSRYFQGVTTPESPQDGLTDVDVNWAVKPNTGPQLESWKDFAPNIFRSNVKVPFQIKISTYESPLGWGWILTIEVWIDGYDPDEFGTYGNHWVYRHHEGPDTLPPEYLNKWFIQPEI